MFTGLGAGGGGRVAVVGNVAGRYWNRIGRVDSSGSALLILITCFLSFPRMSPSVMLEDSVHFGAKYSLS